MLTASSGSVSYFPFAFICRVSYALFFHRSCLLFDPFFPLPSSSNCLDTCFLSTSSSQSLFFSSSLFTSPLYSLHLPNPPSVPLTSYSFHSLQQPNFHPPPHTYTFSLSIQIQYLSLFQHTLSPFPYTFITSFTHFFTLISLHRRLQPSFRATCSPSFPDLEKIADPTDAILSLSCIRSLLFSSMESWQPQIKT